MTDDEETYEVTVSATVVVRKKQPEIIPPPIDPILPPIDPIDPLPAGEDTTVTAPNGQWWRFKGALQNGVYVNGDPWVFTEPGTTVELADLSSMPTGEAALTRHGGMINPSFNDLQESSPMGNKIVASLKQGYDGRATQSGSMAYDETYNAHAPLLSGGTITLRPGDSLVSAESFRPEVADIGNNNACAIARMACVTVVDYIPEADEFRPNYFGTHKIRKRFSDADLSLLPDIIAPRNPKGVTSDAFHLDEGSVYFGGDPAPPYPSRFHEMEIEAVRHLQYWIYQFIGNSAVSLLKPMFQQRWYPRDNGGTYGRLATYVMCNFEDRDVHLTSLLQLAIDAYAVAEGEGFAGNAPFGGGAGYYPSPLWPIRLAGLLFGDEDMQNARDIPTGHTDIEGVTIAKWGEINRVYYSTTAHAQYRMPAGYSNPKGKPLYGDIPLQNVSGGQPGNGTFRDPTRVYDVHAYKAGLPTAKYPDIMADAYEMLTINGVEQTNLGTYMNMSSSMMGNVLSSIAMDDEGFWGGAVVDFALRHANDPQMWTYWGREFDYSNAFANTFRRDLGAHGGTGNGWMAQMWDLILVGGRP